MSWKSLMKISPNELHGALHGAVLTGLPVKGLQAREQPSHSASLCLSVAMTCNDFLHLKKLAFRDGERKQIPWDVNVK